MGIALGGISLASGKLIILVISGFIFFCGLEFFVDGKIKE